MYQAYQEDQDQISDATYISDVVFSMERNFPVAARAQAACSWDSGTELRDYRNLGELTVAVLGVGQMGSATASIFKSLGSRVVGFVRSSRRTLLLRGFSQEMSCQRCCRQ